MNETLQVHARARARTHTYITYI